MLKNFTIIFLFTAVVALSSVMEGCSKEEPNLFIGTRVPFIVPQNFPQPQYNFTLNPLTEEGIELGRHLFYEGRLSIDGNYPCGSCHQQEAAFTTFQHDRSHGYNNSHTLRNAPGLSNLAWLKEFGQDGYGHTLEYVSLKHINHPEEMAESMDAVINKLKSDAEYRRMFKAAFGTETINSKRILTALNQFTLSIVTANTKYDKVKRGEASFDAFEQAGYTIFQAKCASCHTEPLFTDNSYRNIGLPLDDFLKDFGRMRVTGNKNDSLKFRVPSLRNVELTSNYMHDGRFMTLQQVIQHYRTGVIQSNTLDPALVNGISLTDTEVSYLISFLKTLTDSSVLQNSRFSKPL